MGDLANVCYEFEERLNEVSNQCESLAGSIDHIEERLDDAAKSLKARLVAIADDLVRSEKTLYQQHGGAGYVCLLMGANEGLNMHWVNGKETVSDRHVVRGRTVVSTQEVADTIADLAAKVDSGEAAEAVRWINAYGANHSCSRVEGTPRQGEADEDRNHGGGKGRQEGAKPQRNHSLL